MLHEPKKIQIRIPKEYIDILRVYGISDLNKHEDIVEKWVRKLLNNKEMIDAIQKE